MAFWGVKCGFLVGERWLFEPSQMAFYFSQIAHIAPKTSILRLNHQNVARATFKIVRKNEKSILKILEPIFFGFFDWSKSDFSNRHSSGISSSGGVMDPMRATSA